MSVPRTCAGAARSTSLSTQEDEEALSDAGSLFDVSGSEDELVEARAECGRLRAELERSAAEKRDLARQLLAASLELRETQGLLRAATDRNGAMAQQIRSLEAENVEGRQQRALLEASERAIARQLTYAQSDAERFQVRCTQLLADLQQLDLERDQLDQQSSLAQAAMEGTIAGLKAELQQVREDKILIVHQLQAQIIFLTQSEVEPSLQDGGASPPSWLPQHLHWCSWKSRDAASRCQAQSP